MRPWLLVLLAVTAVILLVTRFYPSVEHVAVSGNAHYGPQHVMALAGIQPGSSLLWINRWNLGRLTEDPWIEGVRVIRHWPDTVSIAVWEREPVLTDGENSWAADGTLLPGVDEGVKSGLVQLRGWGEPRVDDALRLVELLSPFEPRVISYSPEGFDIELANSQLYTPSVAMLERHWAAWINQRGSRVAVYPWGVSDINE